MPDWLIVTLIVVTIIVVILIAMTSARNARAKKAERDRLRASEHRDSAGARAREAGEEDLRARRHAEAADRRRAEADELEQRAAEMDPEREGNSPNHAGHPGRAAHRPGRTTLGLKKNFDGIVLFLLEHVVAVRRLIQREPVGCKILGSQRISVVEEMRHDVARPTP
jgi:hypothetical protein